jgi:hypothetical protein
MLKGNADDMDYSKLAEHYRGSHDLPHHGLPEYHDLYDPHLGEAFHYGAADHIDKYPQYHEREHIEHPIQHSVRETVHTDKALKVDPAVLREMSDDQIHHTQGPEVERLFLQETLNPHHTAHHPTRHHE